MQSNSILLTSLINLNLLLVGLIAFISNATAQNVTLTEAELTFIEQHPQITIAGTTDSAPLLIRKPDGSLDGIDVEFASLIYQSTGLKILFEDNPWHISIKKAMNRDVDGFSASVYNPERENYFNTSHRYMRSTPKVYVKKGNPKNIHNLSDLKSKTTVIRQGTQSIISFANKMNSPILFKETSLEMIDTLINGEADYFVFFDNVEYLADELGIDYIEVAFTLGQPKDVVFSLRNDWPELTSIINKGLDAIPEYQKTEIRKRWFGTALAPLPKNLFEWTNDEQLYLDQKGPISMCIDPDWLPFEQIDSQGQHIGIAADILKIVQANTGLKLIFIKSQSWSQSIEFAKQRKCDIYSLAMSTPERLKYMDFTSPYVSFPFVIATRNSEIFIDNIEVLFNKEISLVKGYAYVELLRKKYPEIKIVEVQNLLEGLKRVRKGTVYGHIDALATAAYAIQKNGMTDIKIAGKFDEKWELSIATRNDEPILKSIMEKALSTIDDETTQIIYNKWLAIRFEDRINYTLIYKIVAAFIFILLFGVWRHRVIRKLNNTIKEQNNQLQQAYEQYSWLAENMDDVVWVMDVSGKFIYISPSVEKLRGYTAEEIMSQTFEEVICEGSRLLVQDEMRIGIEAAQQGKIPPMRNLRVEQPCRDGSTVWTEVNSRLIVNTDNGSMQFIGLTRDITKAIAYEQELHRLVVTDRLTGLYNRHKLDQVLESNQKLFERYQTQFGVLLLDIDHFKNINDTHGHQVGDTTLRTLAELLTNSSRDTDVIGRWGGEEFLIVVSYADKESLLIFAENLRNQVELYLFDVIEHITISVGVSVFQEGCGTNDVISKADQALYYAKENGRNQVHFSD